MGDKLFLPILLRDGPDAGKDGWVPVGWVCELHKSEPRLRVKRGGSGTRTASEDSVSGQSCEHVKDETS